MMILDSVYFFGPPCRFGNSELFSTSNNGQQRSPCSWI